MDSDKWLGRLCLKERFMTIKKNHEHIKLFKGETNEKIVGFDYPVSIACRQC